MSISKMVKAGRRNVFDNEESGGAFIECKTSGERPKLTPRGKLVDAKGMGQEKAG